MDEGDVKWMRMSTYNANIRKDGAKFYSCARQVHEETKREK